MTKTFSAWFVVLAAILPLSALAQTAPAVTVAPAEITEVRPSADFTGRVEAIQKIDIRARVSGFLEEVAFREGTRVEAGSLLYRIQDEDYRAAVTEIEGQIAAADAQRRLAELERNRKAELVKRNAVAQNELDITQANLLEAEGKLQQLRGTLDRQNLQLSYTEITAPFQGITGLSNADVGALVGPDSGPLTTLTRLDPIEVTFPISTSLLLTYKESVERGGMDKEASAFLTLPNGTEYPIAGDVDYISATVAQGTDTVLVRARFDNPDGVLLDGALVRVRLEERNAKQALTIPQQAVQRDQQGSFVLLVNPDSKVERRAIKTGATQLGRITITEGLAAGDRVITEGINKVRPGMAVDAATSSTTETGG